MGAGAVEVGGMELDYGAVCDRVSCDGGTDDQGHQCALSSCCSQKEHSSRDERRRQGKLTTLRRNSAKC